MYILNETASEAFACLRAVLCSVHCSDCASEGKSDLRLGTVGVTLSLTRSAFRRGGGYLWREVSQAVVDEEKSKAEEHISVLLNVS